MTDTSLPVSFPDLLAGHLAKLNHQLRLLLDTNQGASLPVGANPGPAFSVLSRLRVASALLADPQCCPGDGAEAWQRLGLALGELVAGLHDVPDRLPAHLLSPLSQLAEFMEDVLARIDEGENPADLSPEGRWESLLGVFINAGTVLQILDDMEDLMLSWSRRFGDQDLSASQEEALRRRWALLRRYGDSLFGAAREHLAAPTDEATSHIGLSGRRVMLLLDSPFRHNQLSESLRTAGCLVESASDPSALMDRVEDLLPPQILLCDNLEPSLHLTVVRKRLNELERPSQVPLVLVATTGGTAPGLRDRARQLGAQWVWAEPFRLEDLAAVFGQ